MSQPSTVAAHRSGRSPQAKLAALRTAFAALCILVAIALPFLVSSYWTLVATNAVLAFAVAAPLNMLIGNAGQFSLGNGAFLAVGAYTGAALTLKFDLELPVAMLAAAAVGAVAGFVVGLPSLRLRGAYLLMSTLAAHYIVVFAAQKFQTGEFGAAGAIFPPLRIAGTDLSSTRSMYFVIVVFAAIIGLIIFNVMRSGFGRALEAVKTRDVAAAASGIPVSRMKLSAWSLTSAMIAAGGVLQAYFLGAAAVEFYTLNLAITYIAMIIVGGLGSLGGTFLGACFITLVPVGVNHLSDKYGGEVGAKNGGVLAHPFELQTVVYGLIIIAFVVLKPEGLVGFVRSARNWATRALRGR
ncbi:branched-chain amino acid ABC transporter permease [Dactylosporangium sp. CA-233914]|uniref:branched-chain amino acid ABC transporter permease n=1 Tax=Dactylosporangium sp. CA-233914 TaxID=3239934 RepID=UPI003D8A078C